MSGSEAADQDDAASGLRHLFETLEPLITSIFAGNLIFGQRTIDQRESWKKAVLLGLPKIFNNKEKIIENADQHDGNEKNSVVEHPTFDSMHLSSHNNSNNRVYFVTSTVKKPSPTSRIPTSSLDAKESCQKDNQIQKHLAFENDASDINNKSEKCHFVFKTPKKTNMLNDSSKKRTPDDSNKDIADKHTFLPNLQKILKSNEKNFESQTSIKPELTEHKGTCKELEIKTKTADKSVTKNKFEDAAKRKQRLLEEKIQAKKAATEQRLKAARLNREKLEFERAKRNEQPKNTKNFIGKTLDKLFGSRQSELSEITKDQDNFELERQKIKNLKVIREALATPLDDYGQPMQKLNYPTWCDEAFYVEFHLTDELVQKMMSMSSTEALRKELESIDPNNEKIIRSDDTILE